MNIHKKHHPACVSRKRRLFEDENDDFIIESDFDENEDSFVYILIYILVKLIINNLLTFLSFSSMN